MWAALTLAGHSGTVRCLHLHNNRLVSGSSDRTIKVWYIGAAHCALSMSILVGTQEVIAEYLDRSCTCSVGFAYMGTKPGFHLGGGAKGGDYPPWIFCAPLGSHGC